MAETRTAARMARLVARWRTSGESGASFARRHRIPTWTFWYWRRKLAATEAERAAVGPPPAFVPVQITGAESEPVIEIVLGAGDRLHVRAQASPELVQAAVRAVRSAC